MGGVARYTNDYYHQVGKDIATVPGNPWFICTMWLAQYAIAHAKTSADLEPARQILSWVDKRKKRPSGVLAEQVHPYTGTPLSVAPLTWSHATVVTLVQEYLDRCEALELKYPGTKRRYRKDFRATSAPSRRSRSTRARDRAVDRCAPRRPPPPKSSAEDRRIIGAAPVGAATPGSPDRRLPRRHTPIRPP